MVKSLKTRKSRAFTLAELMVLLSLLTILLAAFAPVFTSRRFAESGGGGVWSYVPNEPNHNVVAKEKVQFFIGIAPKDDNDLNSINNKGTLNISTTTHLKSSQPQSHMQFRYGKNNSGDLVGTLYLDNSNLLLGGTFSKIKSSLGENTFIGANTYENLTTQIGNTGVGAGALKNSGASYATAVGYYAGSKASDYDTLVGANIKSTGNGSNTIIGNISKNNSIEFSGEKNVIIQKYLKTNMGDYNTSIGMDGYYSYNSLSNPAKYVGNYNTAVGVGAMSVMDSIGNYNTAIGNNSGKVPYIGSNKTFIGSNQPNQTDSLYGDDTERVFIGGKPNASGSTGLSILEVHNATGTNDNMKPVSGLGNETVIVNGDLIVRGQTYMAISKIGKLSIQNQPSSLTFDTTKSYALAGLYRQPLSNSNGFVGAKDGTQGQIYGYTDVNNSSCTGNRQDAVWRSACICTYDSNSYLWNTKYRPDNYVPDNSSFTGEDCCPKLSDMRSKNIETPFEGGLKEIEKLRVKNFTFIDDKEKSPHVGIIAQQLKKIFPTAVRKNSRGYYEIRWDEIFYSTINAIKELDEKITKLAQKVENNKKRIAQLKKENAQLEKQLDNLATEVEKLEK